MIPGPTHIKSCPECSCKVTEKTLLSGNTFGATYWTDGRAFAPMLPTLPQLVMCPDCSTFLWLADLNVVEEISGPYPIWGEGGITRRTRDKLQDRLLAEAKSPIIPTFSDYIDYISANKLTSERERYTRIAAWRAGNDPRRDRSEDQQLPLTEKEISNLKCLDRLLDPSGDADRLMKAEIKRELSDFDEAIKLLSRLGDLPQAEVINDLALKGDPFVSDVELCRTRIQLAKDKRRRTKLAEKVLRYVWGKTVGSLLILFGLLCPLFLINGATMWMLLPVVFIASGLGILFRKALGWYLYFSIIGITALSFLGSINSIVSLMPVPMFCFLLFQIKYWRNFGNVLKDGPDALIAR